MIRYIAEKEQSNIPLFLHMELTERCPLCCPQCYCNLENGRDMEWEFCRKVIMEAAEWGVPKILLTGGEPLVYPYLLEVIELIQSLKMQSVFSTSGVGLDKDYCKELKKRGVYRVFVSLNGSCKSIHNLSRDRFEEAISGIQALKKEKIWCGINWVARKDNMGDFENLLKLAQELEVDNIDILSNKPDQYGKVTAPIDNSSLIQLSEQVLPYYKIGFVTVELCYPELTTILRGRNIPVISRGCTAGKLFMEVNVDKSFSLCRHILYKNEESESMRFFWDANYRKHKYRDKQSCSS